MYPEKSHQHMFSDRFSSGFPQKHSYNYNETQDLRQTAKVFFATMAVWIIFYLGFGFFIINLLGDY